ncbi:hypothetical protein GCM10009839_27290 [Catenulispora yoronensis]|uniref:Uncharacterized protein n=1 Tax=Catenulispora yoronensis TaxID=450799 RepID=A0ABP5FKW9_9ACTN
MTMHDDTSADTDRLREAFAEEVDRPGLGGPSLDAVLRAGGGRLRMRRAAYGTTFAVTAAAAVAVTSIAAHGGTAARPAALAAASSPTDPEGGTPAPVVLTAGDLDGHAWQLVWKFRQVQLSSDPSNEQSPTYPEWCADVAMYVDGAWTNSDNRAPCTVRDPSGHHLATSLDHPMIYPVPILDTQRHRYGSAVVGEVNQGTAKVVAQCGDQQFTTTPRVATNGASYFAFAFPENSTCKSGSLKFYDASGRQVASKDDESFVGIDTILFDGGTPTATATD